MIIFVGDKASAKNLSSDIPFVGTKSYRTLLEWICDMNLSLNDVHLCNKGDIKEYKWGGEYYIGCHLLDILPLEDKIVVLGNEAEKRIKKTGLDYFKLPHPSGLNHKLNDKKWLKKELKKCELWLGGR